MISSDAHTHAQAHAIEALAMVRRATFLEIAERCTRDAEPATTDRTGVERRTLLKMAEGARRLADEVQP